MPLTDLPPELLQIIFQQCTTPSFIQAAHSCRALFTLASDSRAVIFHHLNQTPGLPAGSLDSPTPSTLELFVLLKRRAATYLYGADVRADCATFVPQSGSIDPRACALQRTGDPDIAVVERGKLQVHLYRLVAGAIKPVCKLEPPSEYTGAIQVLRVIFAHDNKTISVLVRYEPNAETVSNPVHSYVKEALKHFRSPGIHLLHYRRKAPGKPFSYVTLSGFTDNQTYTHDPPVGSHHTTQSYPDTEYEPLAIDVANPFSVAICWRHTRYHDTRKVVLHTASGSESDPLVHKLTSLIYKSTVIVDPSGNKPNVPGPLPSLNVNGPVVKLRFNDRCSQLLYYHASAAIYRNYQLVYHDVDSNVDSSNVHRNVCNVLYHFPQSEDDSGIEIAFTIDIPIFCTHETYRPGPNLSDVCHWRYLSLGITVTHRTREPIAVLVRSEARCRAFRCQHIANLDRGRRLEDWTMVARLLDYEVNNSSSLAGATAASAGGSRLAIATWKTIRVWAFEPAELIKANSNGFYPVRLEYSQGVVDIEPVVLHADAVIFSLTFVGENELVCLTDKGVMKWDLGPLAGAQRGIVQWLPDALPVIDDEPPLNDLHQLSSAEEEEDDEADYEDDEDDDIDDDDDDSSEAKSESEVEL